MKFNGEKVLRIRHAFGPVYHVQTKPDALYQECRIRDLVIECRADAKALDDCTPRALPDYVVLP